MWVSVKYLVCLSDPPSSVHFLSDTRRFHILCGYLFCQESDLSVYDPAINQEHLMKCLQSLIEAYRDLRQLVGTLPPTPSPLYTCIYVQRTPLGPAVCPV